MMQDCERALAQDDLREENAALRRELELLRDALELMPHGMCAFDGQDRLVLANAHYRKIWNLPPEMVQPGTSFRQILAATPGRETPAARPGTRAGYRRSRRGSWRSWRRRS